MDEIQQKIEEFKRTLESQSPLKEILLSCPAVLPAVGLTVGLVTQFYFNFPAVIWFIVLIFSLVLFLSHRFLIRNQYLIFISVSLCFICLGSFRLINRNLPTPNDIRKIPIQDITFAHIRAKIIIEPLVVRQGDWLFSKFSRSYPYTHFYAKVSDVKTVEGWRPAAGKIKFYISEDAGHLKLGNEFQAFCRLKGFSPPDNPGQFDIARYMHRNGVYLSASVKSAAAITVLNAEPMQKPFSIRAKLRQLAVASLSDADEDNNSRLVEALVLGSRSKIDKNLYNAFMKTGLVHLVCLSGLHVGIFAAFAWWLAKRSGLLHRGRSITAISAIIIFLLIVPPASPTLRAGIMFTVLCLGRLFNRRSMALNGLAISAILLLLIRPMDFLSPGFQLSFAATLGILLFNEPIRRILLLPIEPLKQTSFYSPIRLPLDIFAVGLAAWLAVAPIIAWHFYQFQLFTALWTVPASFPVTAIVILGPLKIIFASLLPSVAAFLGILLDLCADILSLLVILFAKVPFSQIIIGKPAIYIVLLFYLLIFLWKFFPLRKNYIYPAAIILMLISALSVRYFKNLNNLRLTVLSVGHGQAICVKTPDNKNLIFDAGSISKSDIGGRIVNPFLAYTAAGKIDSAFISHDDIDHYNGLPEILSRYKCKNIYTNPQFIRNNSNAASILIEFLKSQNLSLKISPEKFSLNKVVITQLWPKDVSEDLSDNESSLVFLLEYASRKILFCSDIPKNIQNRLMELYPDLDTNIMVVPHHGSARTIDPAFLDYFKPEFLITSSSYSQSGRTSPRIRDFDHNYFTSRDGAVAVSINPAGKIKVSIFKSN
ncbi:MAG: DNA internalization-related competence protein ComEC/Rec2 [Planctomycetes bacterium HGW-Planctomycetes-1]|nr:MAG: DNA internalization-related competence protein ComEC/Rec2 [Planctomycetes bacterium HGW-Planctomycetes-1]